MRGLLNINKPKDWTSFDVVGFVRKALNTKQVGHLGTLDPMATGVLVVTVGSATKIFDMFLNKNKTYIAKFEFGYETDTLDATGKTTNSCSKIPTLDEIKSALPQFVGDIMQLPPQYSAKKVNGQKACDVARKGESIDLKPCLIHIENIEILSFYNKVLELAINCGAGTYIRCIGRDIAHSLGTFASMTSLVRTKVGNFDIAKSMNIDKNNPQQLLEYLQPLDVVFDHLPEIKNDELAWKLLNGQRVKTTLTNGDYRLYYKGEFVAICNSQNSIIKMEKYFTL